MLVRSESSGPEFQIASAIEPTRSTDGARIATRVLTRSSSYRYVSPSIYGADDLDGYGRWVYDAPYGWVWVPSVGPDWAPYRHGRWCWVDWYGWSWVSYDSWGWAPLPLRPVVSRALRLALVSRTDASSPLLVSGPGGVRGIRARRCERRVRFRPRGLDPLGPHEPYHPWYGRGYYRGGYVDRSVHITNVNITNVYRNARVPHGISAIEAGHLARAAAGR